MRQAELLHNAKAGEGKYTKKELMRRLKALGCNCRYYSTKSRTWKGFNTAADLIIIAGGDGTVRKVVRFILSRPLIETPMQLAILPLGTANNIARALNLETKLSRLVETWKTKNIIPYDVGRIEGLPEQFFFIESVGFGPLAALMKKMESESSPGLTPDEELQRARQLFSKIVSTCAAFRYKIEIDGKDHSGDYILAEVLNVPAVGPRVRMATGSDPGDGYFEIVLISEAERKQFLNFISGKKNGVKKPRAIKGRSLVISTECSHAHVDDKIVRILPSTTISVQMRAGLLNFFRNIS